MKPLYYWIKKWTECRKNQREYLELLMHTCGFNSEYMIFLLLSFELFIFLFTKNKNYQQTIHERLGILKEISWFKKTIYNSRLT